MNPESVSKYRHLIGSVRIETARVVVQDHPDTMSINLGDSVASGFAQHSISLELRDELAAPKLGSQVTVSGLGRSVLSPTDLAALQAALGIVIDAASTYRNIVFSMPYPDYLGGERVYDLAITQNSISLYGNTLTDSSETTIEYFISPVAENETRRDGGLGKDLSGLPALNIPPWGGTAEAYIPGISPAAEMDLILGKNGKSYLLGGSGLANDLEMFQYGLTLGGAVVPSPFIPLRSNWDIINDLIDFFASDAPQPLLFDAQHRARITLSEGSSYGFDSSNSCFYQGLFKRTEDWISYLNIRKEGDGSHWYRLEFRDMDYLKRGGVSIP